MLLLEAVFFWHAATGQPNQSWLTPYIIHNRESHTDKKNKQTEHFNKWMDGQIDELKWKQHVKIKSISFKQKSWSKASCTIQKRLLTASQCQWANLTADKKGLFMLTKITSTNVLSNRRGYIRLLYQKESSKQKSILHQ